MPESDTAASNILLKLLRLDFTERQDAIPNADPGNRSFKVIVLVLARVGRRADACRKSGID